MIIREGVEGGEEEEGEEQGRSNASRALAASPPRPRAASAAACRSAHSLPIARAVSDETPSVSAEEFAVMETALAAARSARAKARASLPPRRRRRPPPPPLLQRQRRKRATASKAAAEESAGGGGGEAASSFRVRSSSVSRIKIARSSSDLASSSSSSNEAAAAAEAQASARAASRRVEVVVGVVENVEDDTEIDSCNRSLAPTFRATSTLDRAHAAAGEGDGVRLLATARASAAREARIALCLSTSVCRPRVEASRGKFCAWWEKKCSLFVSLFFLFLQCVALFLPLLLVF